MELMTAVTAFTSIVGLVGTWKSHVNQNESQDMQKFIEWLHRHRHEQIAHAIENDTQLTKALKGLIESNHDTVMEQLTKLDARLSSVAARVAEFSPIALAIRGTSSLSEQAISILRQLNETEMSTLYVEGQLFPYALWNGKEFRHLKFHELQFLEKDLETLCEFGLLRRSADGKSFTITRTGSSLATKSLTLAGSDQHS